MEYITILHSKQTQSKVPQSPTNDKEFVFETFSTSSNNSNLELFNVMASNFILNIPLQKLPKSLKSQKLKEKLEIYFDDNISYIVLDFDKVRTEFDKQQILEYFKNYKVIIGESRSFDGKSNFNLKGLLFTESMNVSEAVSLLEEISFELKELCEVDNHVLRKFTHNAPIMRNNVLLNNQNGNKAKIPDNTSRYIDSIKNSYSSEVSNIPEYAESIETLCLQVFSNMGFIALKGNSNGSLSFQHPSERKSVGGYFWFNTSPFTMHHPNRQRTVNIYDAIKNSAAGKLLLQSNIDFDQKFAEDPTLDSKKYFYNEQYLEVTDEKQAIIQDFLFAKNGIISIKSPMGSAKSNIIQNIIQQAHSIDFKVLIITNRISVAEDFSKKYNIPLYYKDKYSVGESLIVQYDSLWKYSMKFFDIIIMDEFVSLVSHARNNVSNSDVNLSKFFGCFKKKMVIADAFLTGYENQIIQKETNYVEFINEYRDDIDLFLYSNKNTLIYKILQTAKTEKISISCNSLNMIYAIKKLLENQGTRVMTLTSETPKYTKELIYGYFEQESHDKWDVIIYSPTLTVGVSNLNKMDNHFHIDSGMSNDVISSLQMIKRSRLVKNIHIYIGENVKYLHTTYNTLKDAYLNGKTPAKSIMFEMDEYGDTKYSNVGERILKIDVFNNTVQFNNKKSFLWFLKFQFKNSPIEITQKLEPFIEKVIKEIKIDEKYKLQSKIDEFFVMTDIEKSEWYLNNDKYTGVLMEIYEHINTSDSKILKEIMDISIKNKGFVNQVLKFKLTHYYDEDRIRSRISDAILKNDQELLKFLNAFLVTKNNFKSWYKESELNENLKIVLSYIGYKMKNNIYSFNELISKYEEYII